MKQELKPGFKKLKFLYYRYKDSSYFLLAIICAVIFSSIVLFFQLVVPQIENWFSIQHEINRTNTRINAITNNIEFMKSLDKPTLENQVEITTNALPIEKDFGTIVAALSDASLNASVTMDDFTFQVGKVASLEGQLNVFGQKTLSMVKVTVVLSGSFEGVNRFLEQVQNKLPLSEVTEVNGDVLSTTVTIQFYQKKFPEIIFADDVPIPPLSSSQLSVIEKLSTWQPVIPQENPLASNSGGIVPLF